MMRVDQLVELLEQTLPTDKYKFSKITVPKPKQTEAVKTLMEECRGAVVIFHKSAAINLDADTRAALKAVAAGICVDHLDFVVEPFETGFVDVNITASRAGEVDMRRNISGLRPGPETQVRHLRHHADPRLGAKTAGALDHMVPGYFGAAVHVTAANAFPTDMLLPDYDPKDVVGFLGTLPSSNLHFCVRDPSVGLRFGVQSTKPFTKGFNAAAVGANVLVNRQVHDAEYYLGSDYPFLVDGFASDDVAEGLEKARAAFGTATWQRGLDRMAGMLSQVSAPSVAKEFAEIVDIFR